MTEPTTPSTLWQSLAVAADQGQLVLEPGVAEACRTACDDYIAQLREHQSKAVQLGDISGWGDFESGKQLQTIFSKKAIGGPNNMVDVLESHIHVVLEMRAVFAKFFVATEGVDDANVADIQAEGPR
ncbi:MAG: hypothetical protein WBQ44_05425 [Rhodococcus sp. (in: high G+C Gram-positive bacteria)]